MVHVNIEQTPNILSGPDSEKGASSSMNEGRIETPKEARQLHGWKWAVSYTAMLSTTFLFALDNTIVADIQPAVINDLGSNALLPWVGTGFALGSMAILPWSKSYGIFDIRWIYIFNILLFEVGSALCGAAPNMTALIIGRVVAGVGGAGMYSGTLTYVSVCTTLQERASYMAGSTAIWGVGTVLGPVVGGAFAESKATWRWGFYINLVVGALFAPAYLCLFPSIDPRPGHKLSEKARMMDWLMTVNFLAGSAFLTMAITFGGTVYAWHSGTEIAFWALSGVCLLLSLPLARYHPGVAHENRLWPAHFLKMPIVMNLQLQVFLSSGIILAMTYYVPLFFQFIRGDGALEAGIRLLPLIILMVVISMINGLILPKTPLFSPWYIFGSGIILAGTALMFTIDEETSNASIYGYTILMGAGAGCYIVAGFTIVQSLVPAHDIANAVGAMTIAQDLGMVLFLAISGSVFQNMAVKEVGEALPDASSEEIIQLTSGSSSAIFKGLSDSERGAVITRITNAMGNVWLLFMVAAALSFASALCLGKARFKMN